MWGQRWFGARRGWLRPMIISIIARSPKNGAAIMDEIEKMTWGYWRPSPGSVYPLLDELAQEGMIKKAEDGRYELTAKAKEDALWPFAGSMQGPQSVEGMLKEIGGYVTYFEDLARYDRSRITPHIDEIKTLAERLSKVTE